MDLEGLGALESERGQKVDDLAKGGFDCEVAEVPESTVTVEGTNTVVKSFSKSAQSIGADGTKVTLYQRDIWARFHKETTEMLVTKAGRKMFPAISISVAGLEPTQSYTIAIDFLPGQHKYKYDGSKWNIARPAEPHPPQRWHVHPDSPQLGEDWEKKWGITFHKLKITHNIDRLHHDGYLVLNTMHKFQPRVIIMKGSAGTEKSISSHSYHIFPETEFMTVTAYQNRQITLMKIEHNPFAKGFRGTNVNMTLSAPPKAITSTSCSRDIQLSTKDHHHHSPTLHSLQHFENDHTRPLLPHHAPSSGFSSHHTSTTGCGPIADQSPSNGHAPTAGHIPTNGHATMAGYFGHFKLQIPSIPPVNTRPPSPSPPLSATSDPLKLQPVSMWPRPFPCWPGFTPVPSLVVPNTREGPESTCHHPPQCS